MSLAVTSTRAIDALQQRPTLLLVIGRSVGFVAAFAIPVLLSRKLDQTEFGTYKQLFLIYATLFGIAQLGMAESLYYFVPRHASRVGHLIANACTTLAVAGVACLTLLMLASDAIAGWLTNPHITAGLIPLGIFLTLSLVTAPFEIVLIARGRYNSAALAYAVSDLVRVACVITPAVVIGTVSSVMWGAVGFALTRLMAMVWSLRRDLVTSVRPQFQVWRDQLVYALPFALAVVVEIAQSNFHQYVVATRFDTATFAIFAVGLLQMPLVDVITTSSSNVMMVKMSAEGGLDARAALTLWHDTMVRLSLLVFPLAAFMLIIAHDIIVLVFTDAYLASVPIFQLSTLAILPACLCVDAVLRVHAQTRVLFFLNLVRLCVVALLIGGLISAFGLTGAVAATLCATLVGRGLGLLRIARILGVSISGLLPWKRLVTTAAFAALAALPALAARRSMPTTGLFELLVVAAVYGITFLLLCLRRGALSWFGTGDHRFVETRPSDTECPDSP